MFETMFMAIIVWFPPSVTVFEIFVMHYLGFNLKMGQRRICYGFLYDDGMIAKSVNSYHIYNQNDPDVPYRMGESLK